MEGTLEFEFIKPVDSTCGDGCDKFGARNGKHHGIDYPVKKKTVRASEDGVVVRAAMNDITPKRKKAYGNVILIDHTPQAGENEKHIYSLYAHLDSMSVKRGEKVPQGKVIGVSGNTGSVDKSKGSEGYHLHFEIIESPGKMKWYDGIQNNGAMGIPGGVNRKDPEEYLGVPTTIIYSEREVTDADRVSFAERLRIKEKRDRLGNLISHDVWVDKKYAGRLYIDTGEIELSIPPDEFFALIDGPKPTRRMGDARFDVEIG